MKKILLILGITVAICFSSNGQGKIQIPQVQGLNTALNSKQDWLGLPSNNGYILSSTTSGIYSWISPPTGGGTTLNGTGLVRASGTSITYDNTSYLNTSIGDSRYNLVINNINPYNYFVPLDTTQTNDATNHYINGNIHVTGGGSYNGTGDIYTNGNIVCDGSSNVFQANSTYQVSSNIFNLKINSGTNLFAYEFNNRYTDATPTLTTKFGDSSHKSFIGTNFEGGILDRYTLSVDGFQITNQYVGDPVTPAPLGVFDIIYNANRVTATHIFNVYNTGQVEAVSFKLKALNTAPSSSAATGVIGEIRYDANYIYVCTATNTWKRSALTTW